MVVTTRKDDRTTRPWDTPSMSGEAFWGGSSMPDLGSSLKSSMGKGKMADAAAAAKASLYDDDKSAASSKIGELPWQRASIWLAYSCQYL